MAVVTISTLWQRVQYLEIIRSWTLSKSAVLVLLLRIISSASAELALIGYGRAKTLLYDICYLLVLVL
jgi:hypothetical protein